MSETIIKNKLVDTCMKNAGIKTAYELSKRLGVSKELVSTWTRGKSKPDGIHTLELAEMAGLTTSEALEVLKKQSGYSTMSLLLMTSTFSLLILLNKFYIFSTLYTLYELKK